MKSINLKLQVELEKPRTQYVALGLITLLAALLRFYKLGEWSFWIDEIYTIGRAQAHYGSLEAAIHFIPPSMSWFPLSVILTAGTLNALGTSEWSARLVAAVVGVISIPALCFPIKRLFGPITTQLQPCFGRRRLHPGAACQPRAGYRA